MRIGIIGSLIAIGLLAIGSGRLRQAIQAGFTFIPSYTPKTVQPAGKVARASMRGATQRITRK